MISIYLIIKSKVYISLIFIYLISQAKGIFKLNFNMGD